MFFKIFFFFFSSLLPGPRVQNERAVGLIDKITLRSDGKTVCFNFVDPDTAKSKDWNEQTVEQFAERVLQKGGQGASGMFSRLASGVRAATVSEKDALERVYEFATPGQRNEFVLDVLRMALAMQMSSRSNPLPHFFVVNKTGAVGQNQTRIWLLTTDSILNLDTNLKMHSEIGLASVMWVKPDPKNADVVQLSVLDRDEPISVRTEWRDSLVAAITEALPRAAFRSKAVADSMQIHDLVETTGGLHASRAVSANSLPGPISRSSGGAGHVQQGEATDSPLRPRTRAIIPPVPTADLRRSGGAVAGNNAPAPKISPREGSNKQIPKLNK